MRLSLPDGKYALASLLALTSAVGSLFLDIRMPAPGICNWCETYTPPDIPGVTLLGMLEHFAKLADGAALALIVLLAFSSVWCVAILPLLGTSRIEWATTVLPALIALVALGALAFRLLHEPPKLDALMIPGPAMLTAIVALAIAVGGRYFLNSERAPDTPAARTGIGYVPPPERTIERDAPASSEPASPLWRGIATPRNDSNLS